MLGRFPIRAVLPAADLERARAWYEEKLGLNPERAEHEGLWYACGEGTRFFLTYTPFAGTAQNTAAGWDVRDIATVMAELRRRGVVFEEYDLPGLQTVDGVFTYGANKAAWFKDSE